MQNQNLSDFGGAISESAAAHEWRGFDRAPFLSNVAGCLSGPSFAASPRRGGLPVAKRLGMIVNIGGVGHRGVGTEQKSRTGKGIKKLGKGSGVSSPKESCPLSVALNADTALHFPDFRAAERTFELATQVAGRTGRGDRGGKVLVQTFSPDHMAIQTADRHDFARFAYQELPILAEFQYPPTAVMIRLVVRGPSEMATGHLAEHVVKQLGETWEVGGEISKAPGHAGGRGRQRVPHPRPGPRHRSPSYVACSAFTR